MPLNPPKQGPFTELGVAAIHDHPCAICRLESSHEAATISSQSHTHHRAISCACSAGQARAQPTSDPRVADLVRAGKLRVGLFLPQYGRGLDGLKTTVWMETARAYAARIGVPLEIVEHATPTEACLKSGSCGQFFLPLDARAAQIGNFWNPIFQFDYTLMVPTGSTIAKVADADRPGIRIAAVRNNASTNELAR